MRGALDECYGVGVVSLVRAAFRWLNHHSQLRPEHGGEAVLVGGHVLIIHRYPPFLPISASFLPTIVCFFTPCRCCDHWLQQGGAFACQPGGLQGGASTQR